MGSLCVGLIALCVFLAGTNAKRDPIALLRDIQTNETTVIADAMEGLASKHKYSKPVLSKAYERCKDVSGKEIVSCLANAIHIEKLLADHKYDICAFEYFKGTVVECVTACYIRYNPKCLECVGTLIPNLVQCLRTGPLKYAPAVKKTATVPTQ